MTLFVNVNDERIKELQENFDKGLVSLSLRSNMFTKEALVLIIMCIGREIIELKAKELEEKVKELGINDGLVNYLDVAISNMSEVLFGDGNDSY